jgi:hypothetical protein
VGIYLYLIWLAHLPSILGAVREASFGPDREDWPDSMLHPDQFFSARRDADSAIFLIALLASCWMGPSWSTR